MAAAVAPALNSAGTYTVLGTNASPTAGTVTCTNSGTGSTINGDVGSTFTSITSTGCTIAGTIDTPVTGSVVADFTNAYGALDSLNPVCDGVLPAISSTLAPGVYCSPGAVVLGAGIIFTLSGSASDVWVFRVGTGGSGALTATGFQVLMDGSAQACNVYWRTAAAATLTGSSFQGTILSGAAITMTGGSYVGRAFATTDVTVTDAAPMTFAGCSAPASITVLKDFIPNSAATVPVALSCTSGTVTTSPLNAAEGAPAVFQVTGASAGATCTATETVPLGYTANQVNCVGVALNGSCTITNTL
ncbi:MAG: ice-binding family protein, partial [Betaproteobacteria bacterium]